MSSNDRRKPLKLKLKRSSYKEYVPVTYENGGNDPGPKENGHNIPASVVSILRNCVTPKKAMEEILIDGLVRPEKLVKSEESDISERKEPTSDEITAKLRSTLKPLKRRKYY